MEETYDLDGTHRCCPTCQCPYEPLPGTEDSEVIAIEVRAHRRVIRRRRDRRTCQCPQQAGIVETFVEAPRFRGTCYKAANWICLGETQGRGRRDVNHQALLPRKSVWVYPLAKHFRTGLCAPD